MRSTGNPQASVSGDAAMASHQLTVTPGGQITIPEELRHELGIDGGDHLYIERDETGLHIETARERDLAVARRTAGSLAGYVDNSHLTIRRLSPLRRRPLPKRSSTTIWKPNSAFDPDRRQSEPACFPRYECSPQTSTPGSSRSHSSSESIHRGCGARSLLCGHVRHCHLRDDLCPRVASANRSH